jgi:hypothetical protein
MSNPDKNEITVQQNTEKKHRFAISGSRSC